MTTSALSLRILIADDHQVMLEGIRVLIERQPEWKVCGLATNGREAIAQANALKPDIVVLDMTMPELNGLEAAIQIKRNLPDTQILMFTAHESDDLVRKAFAVGVKSFISKTEAHEFLVEAIEALARHKPYFTAKVSDILFSNIANRGGGRRDEVERGRRLSAREREIVQLIAEGKSNKGVADALGVSVRTAEAHRANILRKLKLQSIAALVRYAVRNKIIEA
jgi:two-component system, NarL family, response regulator NreC